MIKHTKACPIGSHLIDERVVRFNAFLTIVVLILGVIFPPLWLLLVIDFGLRIKVTKYSPVARLSKFIVHTLLKKPPKPINAKPKLFAAKIGFLFSLGLSLGFLFQLKEFSLIILTLFVLAASLEAFFNYCLGCKIYQILIDLKLIKLNEPSINEINKKKTTQSH